jgi:hypothetical protein
VQLVAVNEWHLQTYWLTARVGQGFVHCAILTGGCVMCTLRTGASVEQYSDSAGSVKNSPTAIAPNSLSRVSCRGQCNADGVGEPLAVIGSV